MRKNIHLTHVLFYFDGPQVVEGRDSIGGHYVAVLTGNQNSINEYLVVGANPDLLRQFKIGTIDLRDLVIKCGQEGWFIGEDTVNEPMKLNLETQTGPIDSYALLPSEGFHLHNREPEVAGLRHRIAELTIEVTAAQQSREHWIAKHAQAYAVAMHNEKVIARLEDSITAGAITPDPQPHE